VALRGFVEDGRLRFRPGALLLVPFGIVREDTVIPRQLFSAFLMSSRDEYESSCTCPICMEELGTSIESCPCGHVYHKDCIRRWIVQQRICPQCKGDALPLVSLTFNLLQYSVRDSQLSLVDRVGSLQTEIAALEISLETELGEINVLEPLLAEAEAEELAYNNGIRDRKRRKAQLEEAFEMAHRRMVTIEERRKSLSDTAELIRAKVSKSGHDFHIDLSSARRRVQQSEVPKLISFIHSDFRKLMELERESEELSATLLAYKTESVALYKALRQIGASHHDRHAKVKSSDLRLEGFVPLDSMSNKRRREAERLKELEWRKPKLVDADKHIISQEASHLVNLSELVSYLSEGEDISNEIGDYPVSEESYKRGKQVSLDSFIRKSELIEIE
jgi:hypothetical protein